MASSYIDLVSGEKQILRFTVTEKDSGDTVDVSSATFSLEIRNSDGVLLTKSDSDFDKSDGGNGIVDVLCDFSSAEGRYTGILSFTMPDTTIKVHKFGVRVRGTD